MNYPNPANNLTGIVPANLVLATKPLDQLLRRVEGDVTGAERLDFAGIDPLADAIASGHSVTAICNYLNVTMGSWHYWKSCLDAEQTQLFTEAELSYLESLDSRLREMIAVELSEMHGDGDNIEDNLKKADLANKRINAIEKLLKATQFHLIRSDTRNKQAGTETAETHVTQMIVSNEWLAALPDE